MKSYWKKTMIFVVVVAVAIVGAAVAFAQDEAPTAVAPGLQEEAPFAGRRGFGGRPDGGLMQQIVDREAMHAALADALGMTVAELEAARAEGKRLPEIAAEQGVALADVEAAMQVAWETAVNDALAAGTITQEQADKLLERGMRFGKGGGRGLLHGLMQQIFDREAMHATIAEALGMTVAELEAAHADGQRLPEIAEAQGVTLEAVKTAVEAARTAAIEDALAAGTITQEQADLLLSHEWQPGGCGHPGGRGHRGGPRGHGNGNGAGFQQGAPQGVEGNA